MKDFMKKLGRGLRMFWGVLFAICTVAYIVLAFTEPDLRPVMIVLAVVFGLLSILLLRKKKQLPAPLPDMGTGSPISVTVSAPEVPEEILRDMRKYYTKAQALRDAEIMRESFMLIQQTTSFDVFFTRLDLARQKALTLLQAEQAKCKGVAALHTKDAAEGVLRVIDDLKLDFLDRVLTKETEAAQELKTPRGRRNRLEKFYKALQEREVDFMTIEDQYFAVLDSVQTMIAETEKAGEG